MDTKDRRNRSLTRSRCGKELHYTSSSLDSEDCRVPTQKSYSSSETLKAYDHDSRLHYGGCVADLVHHEADEYSRQAGNFRLAELGVCEPAPHQSAYCSDLGLLHRGYSLSAGSDADSDPEGAMSPDRAIQLWGGHGVKSRRSSGLSSRENSALTLTDSDNENKSDEDADRLDMDRDPRSSERREALRRYEAVGSECVLYVRRPQPDPCRQRRFPEEPPAPLHPSPSHARAGTTGAPASAGTPLKSPLGALSEWMASVPTVYVKGVRSRGMAAPPTALCHASVTLCLDFSQE